MFRKTVFAAALLGSVGCMIDAQATQITDLRIVGEGVVTGDNWAAGYNNWNIRVVLLNSSGAGITPLSDAVVFDTTSGALTPLQVKMRLDSAVPADTVIRVYRATGPFNV